MLALHNNENEINYTFGIGRRIIYGFFLATSFKSNSPKPCSLWPYFSNIISQAILALRSQSQRDRIGIEWFFIFFFVSLSKKKPVEKSNFVDNNLLLVKQHHY